MENRGLVSVIVPVYNTENYIGRCINSILQQSYSFFELLLIDDGSSDDSGLIVEEYAKKDSRIHVFHQVNAGVSAARNLGIKEAHGEYVTFIDSDDYINKDCLLNLVVPDYDLVIGSSARIIASLPPYEDEFFLGKHMVGEAIMKYTSLAALYISVAKLYKTSIIRQHQILFDSNLYTCEDTMFVCSYLLHVDRIKVSSYIGYIYRDDLASLSLRGVPYSYVTYFLKQMTSVYKTLDHVFNIDTTNIVYGLIMYIYHRYLVYISHGGIVDIKEKLMIAFADPILKEFFFNKRVIVRVAGKRVIIYNWMMRHRMFNILAFYVKWQKRYL